MYSPFNVYAEQPKDAYLIVQEIQLSPNHFNAQSRNVNKSRRHGDQFKKRLNCTGLGIYKRKKENMHENKKIVYECMFACMFSCPSFGSIEWCYMTECRQCISLRTAVFHHSMIDFNHNLCICAFHVFSLVDFQ